MDKTYEEGLRDGAIRALETTLGKHETRLDRHSTRLARIDRYIYVALGAIFILQALPVLQQLIQVFR